MIDLYLSTPTEAAMKAALLAANVIDAEDNALNGISIDHIGPFSRVTGYDSAGEPVVENYPDWHTNLRGNFDAAQLEILSPLSARPSSPYRVWA